MKLFPPNSRFGRQLVGFNLLDVLIIEKSRLSELTWIINIEVELILLICSYSRRKLVKVLKVEDITTIEDVVELDRETEDAAANDRQEVFSASTW